MKKKKNRLYYDEEKNFDTFLLITFVAIMIAALNLTLSYQKNLIESVYFNVLLLISSAIGIILYFKFKQYSLAAYISVIAIAIGVSGVVYYEGLLSFNFLYYFAIILSTPFFVKRDENFIRINCILFIIVIIFAVITLFVAPIKPIYPFLTSEDVNTRMIINAAISLMTVTMFTIVIVYGSKSYLTALLKDKTFAENEKDKRVVALKSLGHELRTQITSINGITQLITEQKEEVKPNKKLIEKYAKILDACNDQILDLVNDVLDIHKIESGKFELTEKPENLNRLLIDISNTFNQLANSKNLSFKTEFNENITNLNLVFDKIRLSQILRNILTNAIKYTIEGEITLKALLTQETPYKATILFKIEDTGIGISEENYSKIFETFQQVKSEVSDIYGGTGLGLSLTKNILDKMDSSINIESNINSGSIFSFKIDFNKIDQEYTFQNIEALIDNKSCLKDKNILIAEDNKFNLLFTDNLLKKYEATTFSAKNGLEAVEMVEKNKKIDTILLDLEMPKLSGLDAIKLIKKLNPELVVIAFTAKNPDEDLLERLNSYGFDNFITKPFKKEELIKAIYTTRVKP